jgi:hypothetical protein
VASGNRSVREQAMLPPPQDFSRTENMVKATLVHRQGEQHWNAKLNDKTVRQIRTARAQGKTLARFARKYRVSEMAISHVVAGRTWKHIWKWTSSTPRQTRELEGILWISQAAMAR